MSKPNIRIICASAGSGKTTKLTNELIEMIKDGVGPSRIIATTFTNKAAKELHERIRMQLLQDEKSRHHIADLSSALIGTVNSICGKLVDRFCYELGTSPKTEVIPADEEDFIFNQSVSIVLTNEITTKMNKLVDSFGFFTKDFKGDILDWRSIVKDIVKEARANRLSCDDIKKSGTKSWQLYGSFLPKADSMAVSAKNSETFKVQLEQAVFEITNANLKIDNATDSFLSDCKQCLSRLDSAQGNKWPDWIKILKGKVGAKYRDIAEKLIPIASKVYTHHDLHADIKEFYDMIFALAGESLKVYEDYKKQRGLIDFIDQETMVLELLENKSIQKIIAQEIDLLLVDEFQDTSPIQLAIFLKLSECVKTMIWVGDPKQSIYGFRGADPELMLTAANTLAGNRAEVLDTSYRSNPLLVAVTNSMFTQVFKDLLSTKQIVLKAHRKIEKSSAAFLEHWHFAKKEDGKNNKDLYWKNLAKAIDQYVSDDLQIEDRYTKKMRKVSLGDIAILMATNKDCMDLARELRLQGIPTALATTGLLATPEGRLMTSCLKYLNSKKDSLALAEILLLTSQKGRGDEIIDDRICAILNDQKHLWGQENIYIQKLEKIRGNSKEMGPCELFDQLVLEFDFLNIVSTWDNSEKRCKNILRFKELVSDYENRCKRFKTACTITGMLMWLDDLEQNKADEQAQAHGVDAINVLTYHKAKGLEWPVVLLASMDKDLKTRELDVSVSKSCDGFDVHNPLSNRFIRYGINPFSSQLKSTLYLENIQTSELYKKAFKDAVSEDARLLYVGMTRARDVLIFLSRAGKTPFAWINRVYGAGGDFALPLTAGVHQTIWSDDKKNIEIKVREFLMEEDVEKKKALKKEIFGLKDSLGEIQEQSLHVSPSDIIDHSVDLSVGDICEYGQRIAVKGKIDDALFGTAMHNIFALSQKRLEEKIHTLLEAHGLDTALDKTEVMASYVNFYKYINQRWKIKKIMTELPVMMRKNGQIISGIADMILETDEGIILIDHKSFQGKKSQLKEHAALYLAQMQQYKNILNGAGKKVLGMHINFVMSGCMVEIV